jgi:hypothetical protein
VVAGDSATRHADKAKLLNEHFSALLGVGRSPSWDFDVDAMYAVMPPVDPSPLIAPFTLAEALAAVRDMNAASTPGPDGFGPSFFRAAWALVEPDIMSYLNSFYNGTSHMDRIN